MDSDIGTSFRRQILAGHATLVNEEQSPEHPDAFQRYNDSCCPHYA